MSRYTVQSVQTGSTTAIELCDTACGAHAVVLPEAGNNVISFSSGGHRVIAPPADAGAFVGDYYAHTRYGTPILSPPNRVKRGTFFFEGTRYMLPINELPDNHLHGELAHRAWEVVEQGASEERGAFVSCRFDYGAHPDIIAYFPHRLIFTVTHTLREGVLGMAIAVRNASDAAAPFALGLHPYFPVPPNEPCKLIVPAAQEWPVTREAFVTGPPAATEFAKRLNAGIEVADYPLVGCSMVTLREDERVCTFEMNDYRIRYRIGREFPFVLLFKPDWASAFSLEPYTYVTDAFNVPYPAEMTGAKGIGAGEELTLHTAMWAESI